jgi:DNA-directed RNA polymerase specialized sigma24 family protein
MRVIKLMLAGVAVAAVVGGAYMAGVAHAQGARPTVNDPVNQVISSEELRALVACISTALSDLESKVLSLYLDGHSYEQVGAMLGCDCKTVDNALQRVKRDSRSGRKSRIAVEGPTRPSCTRSSVSPPARKYDEAFRRTNP